MKISLSIQDRIVMTSILPKEADFVTQVIVKDIIKKTEIDQEEMESIGLKFDKKLSGYVWKKELAKDKDFDFTVKEISLIQDQIKTLDSDKKITQENLSICIKFKEV